MASSLSLDAVQSYFVDRILELQTVQGAVMRGIQSGNLQSAYDLPRDTIVTAVGAIVLVQLVVVLLTKGGRSFIFKTIDTILALIFLAIIIALVLGLPVGKNLSIFCSILYID